MTDRTARALSEGKAVGWMQGRMEFDQGHLVLGAFWRTQDRQKCNANSTLAKYRKFSSICAQYLKEHLDEWFEMNVDSPYMLFVADVLKNIRIEMTESEKVFGIDKLNVPKSQVPAVTHEDHSARIQTVHADTNRAYHDLIARFHALTGCPMLVNTSFNVRGEPIVCSPTDAFAFGYRIGYSVVGDFFFEKDWQDSTSEKIM